MGSGFLGGGAALAAILVLGLAPPAQAQTKQIRNLGGAIGGAVPDKLPDIDLPSIPKSGRSLNPAEPGTYKRGGDVAAPSPARAPIPGPPVARFTDELEGVVDTLELPPSWWKRNRLTVANVGLAVGGIGGGIGGQQIIAHVYKKKAGAAKTGN